MYSTTYPNTGFEYVTCERSLNSIKDLKLLLNMTFTLRNWFVVLFYRRFAPTHACVVEEASRLGCSYCKRRIAPGHTTRNTLLEIDVLGFQRAIHQPYSTDLATLDFTRNTIQ